MDIEICDFAAFSAAAIALQVEVPKADIVILRPDAVVQRHAIWREEPQVDIRHKAVLAALQVDCRFAARGCPRPSGAFAAVTHRSGDIGNGLADQGDGSLALGGEGGIVGGNVDAVGIVFALHRASGVWGGVHPVYGVRGGVVDGLA